MKPTYIHTGPDKLVSLVEKEYKPKMTRHKIYDQQNKFIFEGSPEQCYEFVLKAQSTYSEDHRIKYENYLKNKKK